MTEHIRDDFDFISADQLVEGIQNWLTTDLPDLSVIYLENGRGDVLRRAVLLENTLTDGSKVYNIRLSS